MVYRDWNTSDSFVGNWVSRDPNEKECTATPYDGVCAAAVHVTKWEKHNGSVDHFWIDKYRLVYLRSDDVWGNAEIELTKQENKYTNGEIKNNIKYIYKGLE